MRIQLKEDEFMENLDVLTTFLNNLSGILTQRLVNTKILLGKRDLQLKVGLWSMKQEGTTTKLKFLEDVDTWTYSSANNKINAVKKMMNKHQEIPCRDAFPENPFRSERTQLRTERLLAHPKFHIQTATPVSHIPFPSSSDEIDEAWRHFASSHAQIDLNKFAFDFLTSKRCRLISRSPWAFRIILLPALEWGVRRWLRGFVPHVAARSPGASADGHYVICGSELRIVTNRGRCCWNGMLRWRACTGECQSILVDHIWSAHLVVSWRRIRVPRESKEQLSPRLIHFAAGVLEALCCWISSVVYFKDSLMISLFNIVSFNWQW